MEQPLPLPVPTPLQARQMAAYAALIRQWNPKINLVAPSTLPQLEARHLTDCAQLVSHVPQVPCRVLDVGSGAGLPGLVLAILAPQHSYTLAERDQRKAAFLRTACHALGLAHVTVHADDVKTLPDTFQIITARAWAGLADIIALTRPLLAENGCWLLLKGQALDTELKACETLFHLTTARWPSIVPGRDGERGWVVKITPAEDAPLVA
jgi:16S rRNA (guanine527-N7)-methyltransferase